MSGVATMVQVCTKCSRSNPDDACYCYFDGFVLANGSLHGGPLAISAQMFAQPFVFPTGRQCRNFDELAMACQQEWPAARDLLNQGYLESFFSGLGRPDLVMTARQARKFPDPDRGLDQLLAKLPSEVLDAPKLAVETREINLGILQQGASLEFDLHLENQGMRLLHGSVTCADAKSVWLTLGDAPGTTEKHIQFGHEQAVKVKVCGDRLRARSKPHEARLLVDSNGGRTTITVRAEVPVKPFIGGALTGCKSPRQLAQKAKDFAKEAAAFFECGDVEAWYKDNGWTYPVQGPASSGLHAIQQFFEALGLVKPPVVEINTRSINLSGSPGEQLSYEIKVVSQERRPVYAHAVSDQPWLKPERARLNGRTATIPVAIPSVPNKPGRTLNGRLTIQSNGDQRFVVPVSLAVQGAAFDLESATVEMEVVPTARAAEKTETVIALPKTATRPGPGKVTIVRPAEPQLLESMLAEDTGPRPRSSRRRQPEPSGPWLHLLPAALLVFAVLTVVIVDVSVDPQPSGPPVPKRQPGQERLTLSFHPDRHGSFGLEMKDPTDPARQKRLSFDPRGKGDNIIVKIDDSEFFFHLPTLDHPNQSRKLPDQRKGMVNTKVFKEFNIEVEQHVELVAGTSGNLDTCLVKFTITNKNKGTDKDAVHRVGLRVMMDTYIGDNDGVPFTISGQKGFLDTMKEFQGKDIPDYIEAIEKPETPDDLGTVVLMGLRNLKLAGFELEPVDRLRICHYPGSQTQWDWDMEPMNKDPNKKDSCVAIYWANQEMKPGAHRVMGYTYGLSGLSIEAGDSPVALSVPPLIRPHSEFLLTAYIWNAHKGQKIAIELPPGLELADKEEVEKSLEKEKDRVQVSWKVKAGGMGEYDVTTRMGTRSKPFKVKVRDSIF
jgi:hypothetical protein